MFIEFLSFRRAICGKYTKRPTVSFIATLLTNFASSLSYTSSNAFAKKADIDLENVPKRLRE